jgi:hypothetical protein
MKSRSYWYDFPCKYETGKIINNIPPGFNIYIFLSINNEPNFSLLRLF